MEVPICSCPHPQEMAKERTEQLHTHLLKQDIFGALSSVLVLLPSSALSCCSVSSSSDSSASNDCAEPSEDEECRDDDEDDKFETPVVDMIVIVPLSNDKQQQISPTSSILNEISPY